MRGGRHVRSYLDGQPNLRVSVSYVWLPMLPRFSERRALPKAVAEFADAGAAQYWDDTKLVGREFKGRIIPSFDGDVGWDAYVLFDEQATWQNAGEHVVSWGSTVMNKADQLFDHLGRLPKTPAAE